MVLVCVSAVQGRYRIEDDEGNTLIKEFFSIANPLLLAQRVANTRGYPVTLRVDDAPTAEAVTVHPPTKVSHFLLQ